MFSYISDESWQCINLQNWGYNSWKSLCIWVTKQLWQIVFSKIDTCLYSSLIWHAFLTLWLKSSLRLLLLNLSEVSWLYGSVERWQRWQGAPILRLVPCMHCLIKFSQKPLRKVLLLSSHFTDDNAEACNSCPKSRSYKQQVEKLNPDLCSSKTPKLLCYTASPSYKPGNLIHPSKSCSNIPRYIMPFPSQN